MRRVLFILLAAYIAFGLVQVPGAAGIDLVSYSSAPDFASVHHQLAVLLIPSEYAIPFDEFIWRQDFEIQELGLYWLFNAEGYAPVFLYDLAAYPQLWGDRGALVSMPDRYNVIVLPLTGSASASFAHYLVNGTMNIFFESDDPVAHHIWWYRRFSTPGGQVDNFEQVDFVWNDQIFLLLPAGLLE